MTDFYERDENVDDVAAAGRRGDRGLTMRRPETDLTEGNASRHATEDFRGVGSWTERPARPGDEYLDDQGDPIVLP